MGSINDLQTGANFTTVGLNNFYAKLRLAIQSGELHNLKDNYSSIESVLKNYEDAIRHGHFDRYARKNALEKLRHLEGDKLTREDYNEFEKILERLSNK
ncbi:MAG: hypothetical protein MUF50_00930 [Planctomycetes bacterium]|jgi:hypothetical protein|nr:hypothetical protein [Planctomycetota bacterium]